jgi:hypothetical protein
VGGMSKDMETESGRSPTELEADRAAIANLVRSIVAQYQGDGVALLKLLRTLEELHRDIREGPFQNALPDNRQALHTLLKDVEADGGWPYINRMRLQAFLGALSELQNGGGVTEPSDSRESVE